MKCTHGERGPRPAGPGLFTPARPAWSATHAAQALKISRASAYRYFSQLEDAGFIEPVAGHRYALGPRIVELDRQIRLADPLVQASADEMVKLARETGGIALLCRLHKHRVLCIHQERGARAPRFVSYERGRAMPLHRGATSKVILAFLPKKDRDPLAARVDAKALDAIRREAFVAYGEVDPDASASPSARGRLPRGRQPQRRLAGRGCQGSRFEKHREASARSRPADRGRARDRLENPHGNVQCSEVRQIDANQYGKSAAHHAVRHQTVC